MQTEVVPHDLPATSKQTVEIELDIHQTKYK